MVTKEEDTPIAQVDKSAWKGIAVYVDHNGQSIHNVTFELIGKARALAAVTGDPVYAVMLGSNIAGTAEKLLHYGVDKVYIYDDPALKDFLMEPYANAFEDFIKKIKPSCILVGATNLGRTLAPRVAARFHTGLTADCTRLEMRENSDLVQIRPAFGGNIMAQIVTTNSRPQFATVRYKVFSAPSPSTASSGTIEKMQLAEDKLQTLVKILTVKEKEKSMDISEADILVACGRGFKNQNDLAMAQELADVLGAQLACSRPLVEGNWFDARHQIGLSGRTVHAKLIITLGIAGKVQFAAGMKGSDCIVAINSDPHAQIFDVAHYAVVGDLYEILPQLITLCKEAKANALS
jgi:electron transfer flavoprotein alpha subunit